jgi:hypothetical protein
MQGPLAMVVKVEELILLEGQDLAAMLDQVVLE